MVRFSCFPSHSHFHKQKKSVQLSAEAMHKMLEDCSSSQAFKDGAYEKNPSDLERDGDTLDNSFYHVTDSYIEPDLKSEQIEQKSNTESDIDVRRPTPIKKTMSLGSGLDRTGKVSGSNESEDGTDQRFSCDGSHSHSELVSEDNSLDFKVSIPVQFQESMQSDSLHVNGELLNNGSVFSIGDPRHPEKEGQENPDLQLSGGDESNDHMPRTPPRIAKSSSLPNMHSPLHSSTCSLHYSRSAEDLKVIDSRRKEMSTYEIGTQVEHQEEKYGALNNGKGNCETVADDSYDAYNYIGSAKEWIIPVADEVKNNNHQGQSSFCRWNNVPSKDFKIKRIEEWVSGLQHYSSLEETGESSDSRNNEEPKNDAGLDSPTARLDVKANPSIEGVNKYISSLSATSTAVQLANHGLVVIPFLSAFTSLRALNLSGNAIVRITAGSLPRGLHVLNLSKNKISTIEGLRELTRLRVLDISYNRILRIGHGLASCSSLKELYLAGNKISEVEGLHRLLKLNVLDLRFNKISTAKCLGQLAANYNSLQAIGLEGNPAQKNIGDEQIKKYLQGLLPRLAYYNRQPIKVGILRDAGDRSARVTISSHKIERNLRTEHKTIRKGLHAVASHKASSSSIHGRRSQATASSKASRSRNGHLLPGGTKISTDRHHIHDFSSKLLNFKSHLSIHRSRSEGNLGAL